jgi:hypothetical protein
MILVLCGAGDHSARAAHRFLVARGEPCLLLDAALLDQAMLRVAIGVADDASLAPPGGAVLRPENVRAVLNRCPPPAASPGPDGGYIAEEKFAARLALLGAFRCVNAPSPRGLAGIEQAPEVWRHLAALAGLPAVPWPGGGAAAQSALVVGQAVFGLPPTLHGAARALAGFAGLDLMGLWLDRDGSVLNGTALPDLAQGGADGFAALADLLVA